MAFVFGNSISYPASVRSDEKDASLVEDEAAHTAALLRLSQEEAAIMAELLRTREEIHAAQLSETKVTPKKRKATKQAWREKKAKAVQAPAQSFLKLPEVNSLEKEEDKPPLIEEEPEESEYEKYVLELEDLQIQYGVSEERAIQLICDRGARLS